MSQDHKEVIHRIFDEVFNGANHDLISELYTPDISGYDPANGGEVCGLEALRALLDKYREAFPDHKYELHTVIAEDAYVAVRWTVRGTHINPLGAVAATNKSFTISGLSLCEFCDGKVCRVWQHWDNMGLYNQLGIALGAVYSKQNF